MHVGEARRQKKIFVDERDHMNGLACSWLRERDICTHCAALSRDGREADLDIYELA